MFDVTCDKKNMSGYSVDTNGDMLCLFIHGFFDIFI